MNQDTLPSLVSRLLQRNKIPFDKAELSFQIQSHPSYPSLHAITGVLDHFKIENVAASIPVDEASLKQVPDTIMAQLGHDLVVATQKEKGIEVYDHSLRPRLLTTGEFLEKFTGIVVAVEQTEETTGTSKPDHTFNVLAGVISLILLTSLFVSGAAPASLTFLALGIIGLGISVAILKQEFGIDSTLGNALCSAATEKKDCDAVLKSKGAVLLGRYKFSDLSLVYFLALTLFSFFTITSQQSLAAGYYLSLLAIPITLYSIYYQGMVVKKWCLLCLSIVGLLWIQVGVAVVITKMAMPVDLSSLLLLALTGFSTFAGWTYLRPKYEEFRGGLRTRIDFAKFKRNFELFISLLNKSEAIDTRTSSDLGIVFGHPDAPTEITVVTNPFCGHCKPVHVLIEDILSQYPGMSQIVIRFNIPLGDEESDVVKIATRLLEIFEKQGKDLCLMAMGEIYAGKPIEEWLSKWSACSDPLRYMESLKAGIEWCNTHKLNFTPVILINGRSFPASYERTDLIYFIEDLYEAGATEKISGSEAPEEVLV